MKAGETGSKHEGQVPGGRTRSRIRNKDPVIVDRIQDMRERLGLDSIQETGSRGRDNSRRRELGSSTSTWRHDSPPWTRGWSLSATSWNR
jgi:hypothetical protein